ncbi:phosphate ABC transporter permease PstA [Vibrio fluvialis]|uniref:phosphate ABC transporter permease PstA n=1 Tax=Vibrio fluvialis TaxID=676 RepID=UPI0014053B21|nr:phosphate ABC transporter permease PstA [Vibrio fluvialis]EKO3978649.1 phosphate ABC transporter permease PstA [Vibrio fluvialis]MBY8242906.1 phosphate ABC transporter permease PstA [Vibrio fluvialis]NHN71564.1 phosphate ABC transporter permease PstA [Vibrio fluvialis]
MNTRRIKNRLFQLFCYGSAAMGLLVLASILYTLISRGLSGINLALFTEITPGPGSAGGLKNAFIGSLEMTFLSIFIATPIALLAGTWLAEQEADNKWAQAIRFLNNILMSAPSILVGLFVYALIVVPSGGYSGWAGCIALAVLALPTIIAGTEEMLRLVPSTLKEAGRGLGAANWVVVFKLCYRSAASGLITAILLSFARISGETAPLLFTALNSNFMSTDFSGPVANLPVTIYQFAMSPYESWQQLAWSGALIVTLFILLVNISASHLPKLFKR